jgi:hypothetical protein
MAEVTTDGISSATGNALMRILMAPEILPGDGASYETCKEIYLGHVLGGKMVDAPIKMAQSQAREITVPAFPGERVTDQFKRAWVALDCDNVALSVASTARIYGIGSLIYGVKGAQPKSVIDPWALASKTPYFNVLDPLNTSGSLVLSQDPNAPDFQKWTAVSAAGQAYHPSRAVVLMNERPVYIAYTNSAFGYVGRSVYQRALYPLKSFISTMITDDMIAQKAGLLVVKMKQGGSITNRIMAGFSALKREMLKGGRTGNVLNIGTEDNIETLNMMNLDGAAGFARTNIIKNIATAADMPAVMLENETLTEGFGEGTEDAKIIAGYVDGVRRWMKPVYDFLDEIVMHHAWTPEFYATIQAEFPAEYGSVDYKTAFYRWKNSFVATWPSLLKEPPSEEVKVQETILKALVSFVQVLAPEIDPENKGQLVAWVCDNVNELKLMFPNKLDLDIDAVIAWAESAPERAQASEEPKPGSPALKLAG